jgi:hypothetical protein
VARTLPARLTVSLAAAGLWLLLAAGGSASAAPPEVQVRGPYCLPTGCPGTPRSALGSGAGFATAAATAFLLARRSAPQAR